MKKIILIHGWGGSPTSEPWFKWLVEEFDKIEIKILIPEMPNTEEPVIEEWLNKMSEVVQADEETYFIGHSIGCQAVLRYLEKLDSNVKIAGAAFVAPWMHLDSATIEEEGPEVVEVARPWVETPLDWEKIKIHSNNFLCIFSDNDPYVPLTNEELFKENLGAKTIVMQNEEHFNETKEIPEITNFIKWK